MPSILPSTVPTSRGIIFHTLHLAVRESWGAPALDRVVAALPPDVAEATYGPGFVAIKGYPTAHLMAWQSAIHAGPAEENEEEYARCIDRSLDHAIGGVRRLFMRIVTPRAIATRAGEMWRHFHSHGHIELDWRTETSGRVILSDHLYVHDRVGQRTFAEMIRYMLGLSRARGVRETHRLDPAGRLVVMVSWEA